MDNNQKEFYIKKVEKYNVDNKAHNRDIKLAIIVSAFTSLTLAILIIENGLYDTIIWDEVGRLTYTISTTLLLMIIAMIHSLFKKTGIKHSIEEIKGLFEYHGLTLDEEVAKSKGK